MFPIITQVLIGLVALIQIGIGIGEMFFWSRLYQRIEKTVPLNEAEALKVEPIVKNAGLYNFFLAAGLIGSLIMPTDALIVQSFLLSCVLIAGIFGAITLSPRTLIIQTVPSLLALIATWYVHSLI